jgi:3,4-dihydroxy 2-butanone 4-phosphate synthase/GTP cyclohydrolase II
MPIVTITEIASRRLTAERPLQAVGRERVVTHHGQFAAVSFVHTVTGESHLALVRGNVEGRSEVPLAVRSSSPADDLLAGLAPSGENDLARILRRFARAEAGILVHLPDRGPADQRALDLAAAMVAELAPASVLPLDPTLDRPLTERGLVVSRPRTSPRLRAPRGDRCREFGYELDTAI